MAFDPVLHNILPDHMEVDIFNQCFESSFHHMMFWQHWIEGIHPLKLSLIYSKITVTKVSGDLNILHNAWSQPPPPWLYDQGDNNDKPNWSSQNLENTIQIDLFSYIMRIMT